VNPDSAEAERMSSKAGEFPLVESALLMWINIAIRNHFPISGDILSTKALQFNERKYEKFTASHGWTSKFKKRAGMRNYRIHGEAASAPTASLPEFREQLQGILSGYASDDIYNADETGLYYRMSPNQTLSTAAVQGKKRTRHGSLFFSQPIAQVRTNSDHL